MAERLKLDIVAILRQKVIGNIKLLGSRIGCFFAATWGFIHEWADNRGTMSPFAQTRKNHDSLCFGAYWLVCRNKSNSSSAPSWSGLVAIVWALVIHELGRSSWVGRWNGGGLCTVLLCCCVMSLVVVVVAAAAVVLFVYFCLRVLVCSVIQETWCSVTRAGCLPPMPTLLR